MALEKDYSPQKSLAGNDRRPSQQEIEEYHARRIGEVAQHIAKEMGHEGPIHVSHDIHKFELNGKEKVAAATYEHGSGKIHLYTKGIDDPSALDLVLPHEIGHHRYNVVRKLAQAERSAARRHPEHGKLVDTPNWSPDMHTRYPNLSVFTRHTGEEPDKEHILDKSDGVTQYTRDWWKAVKEGTAGRNLALDETHADVTALHHRMLKQATEFHSAGLSRHLDKEELADQMLHDVHGVHPSWRAFRKDLHEAYTKHVEKQKQNFLKTLATRGK